VLNGVFDWEKPLVELETKIAELREFTDERGISFSEEIGTLEKRARYLREEIYSNLSPWQKVLIARHKMRPSALDYINRICEGFLELHGDRTYRDDPAMVGGIGLFNGEPVTIIGPQKGRDTKENIERNFGQPHPEGYRKALRLMKQAEKFGRPVISLIDVVGAYPGIEAEERGQGVIIAQNIKEMSFLRTPIVCVITGQGGSGGALAIGVGDRLLMMSNAWYSVCSPEMCAKILWRDASRAEEAAASLALTAQDLARFGIVDEIIDEPLGGAHKDVDAAAVRLKEAIMRHLQELKQYTPDELVSKRLEKTRKLGQFAEKEDRPPWQEQTPSPADE